MLLAGANEWMTQAADTPGDLVAWGDPTSGLTTPPAGLGRVIGISAGRSHNLVIRPDGTVVAFGGGVTVPGGAPRAKEVAAGGFHSLILGTNGLVFGWSVEDSLRPPGNLGLVSAIAAGDLHCLALRGNGTVTGWGFNDRQQITIPAGLNSVVAIAAGEGHSLALRSDGSVVGWGDNTFGQAPRSPGLSGRMKAIAAGGNHSLALRDDGRVFAWGDNSFGQRSVPSDLGVATAISAGANFSMALLANRTIRVWGDSSLGQANLPSGFTNGFRIEAGSTHALAIQVEPAGIVTQPEDLLAFPGTTVNLSVTASGFSPLSYQWRRNGNNLTNATALTPTLTLANVRAGDAGTYSVVVSNAAGTATSRGAVVTIADPPVITRQPAGSTVAAGSTVSLLCETTGFVPAYQWRKNGSPLASGRVQNLVLQNVASGDSGDYDVVVTNIYGAVTSVVAQVAVKPTPKFVRQPLGFTVYAGTAGALSVAATDADTYQWFFKDAPLPGANQPTLVINPATAANAGSYHVQIANPWASNLSTKVQVGLLPGAAFSQAVGWGEVEAWNGTEFVRLIPPPGLSSLRQIAAGRLHGLLLTPGGSVMGWGDNAHGELLPPPGLGGVTAIAAGDGFSVALKGDGSVAAWGRGEAQQTNVSPGAVGVVAVAAGSSHTLALKQDGTLAAWGSQQFGEGSVPGAIGKSIAIAAGAGFNLVVLENRTVTGWGRNDVGQRRPPAGLSNVVSVAAGRAHGLALLADGSVAGWGDNSFGQVSIPPLDAPAIALSAGDDHSAVLLANNQVKVWGKNGAGQTDLPGDVHSVYALALAGDHCLALRLQGTRFRPLQIVSRGLRLALTSYDGGAITAQRVPLIDVYASEDPGAPLTEWKLLSPGALHESGELRWFDNAPAVQNRRFYRAFERPF